MTAKEKIAKRIAQELPDGALVNLGAGVPLLCAKYVPEGVEVFLHAENGIVGILGRIHLYTILAYSRHRFIGANIQLYGIFCTVIRCNLVTVLFKCQVSC